MTSSGEAQPRRLGIIGGSGLYAIEGLRNVRSETVDTPWGAPSGPLTFGQLEGVDLVFIARHGAHHTIPPHAINYRANIDALKRAGVTDIISISACGSFREELSPGTFVIVDQFIDRTTGREASFFGPGCVAHVSMANPVCPALTDALAAACAEIDVQTTHGGTYVCMNGPQFSSRAESLAYKAMGADVIGMTNMPEAKLAREAELPYATLAMVTDYDCWRDAEPHVEVANVLEVMAQNNRSARLLLPALARHLSAERQPSPLGIETCLDFALITPPGHRDPSLLAKLDAVAGRALR